MGNFPLWTTVFPAARWHAGVNGCVCICVAGLVSDTARRRPIGLTGAHNDVMGAAAFASVVISLS